MRPSILCLCGSTRAQSVNLHILQFIAMQYRHIADFEMYTQLDQLPHFNPDLDKDPLPAAVSALHARMEAASGILISTPEYVFSLPGSLKNAMEWMVSTTLLTNKPAALITASSSGMQAHESLRLIMRTVGASISDRSSLLISAPKTKIDIHGEITDPATLQAVKELMDAFLLAIQQHQDTP